MSGTHLVVIGERLALAWVLSEQRMAFPSYRAREVSAVERGDDLLIYTTRGAWHNPTRDRGRVIAHARVTTPVMPLDPPVEVAGREFALGCGFKLLSLAPFRDGVELAPLVPELESLPGGNAWAMRLRRPLVTLSDKDAELLKALLDELAGSPKRTLPSYLDAVAGVQR